MNAYPCCAHVQTECSSTREKCPDTNVTLAMRLPLPFSVPRRSLARIINTDKRPVHLVQPLQTILQRLRDIMCPTQPRVFPEHNVHFHPDSVARVVCGDGFVGVDDGGKAPCEEGDLFEHVGGYGGAGEAGDVFETRFGPVVDDEEGKDGSADGVEPPEVELVPDQREEEGERVEDNVSFTV